VQVICYDTEQDIMETLSGVCAARGKFDAVFDSVSSHDPRDSVFSYEKKIRQKGLIGKGCQYCIIGGLLWDWVCAHFKRHLGIDLFAKDRFLHWVRFPNASGHLKTLKECVEKGGVKSEVCDVFPLTSEGVQEAFAKQMSRRVTGKLVIDMERTAEQIKSAR
jgi:NADPH:quinone reductase-like Zn-dependent oxidoreductase